MACTRMATPLRGAAYQLGRLPSMAASSASQASITQSAEQQTVLATIHQFPSLEPLRFDKYPAHHLYLPTRRDILHRAVIYEGDNTRLGTASTKTRHEVRGSARKIRPQKGSGRARLGDKKSPMLRGGGVAFGPRPRDFGTELPKKVYHLAWRTALSYRFRKGELIIVDNDMEIESPSVRLLGDIFKYHEKLRGRGRNRIITLEERPLLEHALEQMGRGGQALTWDEVDVKDLLDMSRVIIERKALHNILISHQEDITHRPLKPWSKSLIRSAPSQLEEMLGWSEFRELQRLQDVDPSQLEIARPNLYEDVADKRYTYAASLPDGPQRRELSMAAYNLLADAKELHFKRTTGGLSWADYTTTHGRAYPRAHQLEYQRSLVYDRADGASGLERAMLELEAAQLELEEHDNAHEVAVLAAMVWEHRAEAQRLAGKKKRGGTTATASLAHAQAERAYAAEKDLDRAKCALEVAKRELAIATMKSDAGAHLKAQRKVDSLTQEVRNKEDDMAAQQEMDEQVETEEELPRMEAGQEVAKMEETEEKKKKSLND
ncbi:54S ribosomal protein yml6, mitochondrial [Pleosporales sp. CAS-2024a]